MENLIKSGAPPNLVTGSGLFALLSATYNDNRGMIDRLLDLHCNPNLQNSSGMTCLIHAAASDNGPLISYLAQLKPRTNRKFAKQDFNSKKAKKLEKPPEEEPWACKNCWEKNKPSAVECHVCGHISKEARARAEVAAAAEAGALAASAASDAAALAESRRGKCKRGYRYTLAFDIDFEGRTGMTALLATCEKGLDSALVLVLARGADVNRASKRAPRKVL